MRWGGCLKRVTSIPLRKKKESICNLVYGFCVTSKGHSTSWTCTISFSFSFTFYRLNKIFFLYFLRVLFKLFFMTFTHFLPTLQTIYLASFSSFFLKAHSTRQISLCKLCLVFYTMCRTRMTKMNWTIDRLGIEKEIKKSTLVFYLFFSS